MPKLQNYSDSERTIIFAEAPGEDVGNNGVILSGHTITHALVSLTDLTLPGHPIPSAESALEEVKAIYTKSFHDKDLYDRNVRRRIAPETFNQRSFILTLKDGTQVITVPPHLKNGLTVEQAIAGTVNEGAFEAFLRDPSTGSFISTQDTESDLRLPKAVMSEMKKYAFALRNKARDEDIQEIRPDAGKRPKPNQEGPQP